MGGIVVYCGILTSPRVIDLKQEGRGGSFMAVLHAALVACSLYLLISFISHDWADVAPVLLAHPKVDPFSIQQLSGVVEILGQWAVDFQAPLHVLHRSYYGREKCRLMKSCVLTPTGECLHGRSF
jgi:hypothetical protein